MKTEEFGAKNRHLVIVIYFFFISSVLSVEEGKKSQKTNILKKLLTLSRKHLKVQRPSQISLYDQCNWTVGISLAR